MSHLRTESKKIEIRKRKSIGYIWTRVYDETTRLQFDLMKLNQEQKINMELYIEKEFLIIFIWNSMKITLHIHRKFS
jgi:hypothetical protein